MAKRHLDAPRRCCWLRLDVFDPSGKNANLKFIFFKYTRVFPVFKRIVQTPFVVDKDSSLMDDRAFSFIAAPKLWNELPTNIRLSSSSLYFKSSLIFPCFPFIKKKGNAKLICLSFNLFICAPSLLKWGQALWEWLWP